MATPECVARRPDGGPFLLRDSGPGEVGYCSFIRNATPGRYLTLKFGGQAGRLRNAPPSGPSCTLPTRRSMGVASRAYTLSFRGHQMRL